MVHLEALEAQLQMRAGVGAGLGGGLAGQDHRGAPPGDRVADPLLAGGIAVRGVDQRHAPRLRADLVHLHGPALHVEGDVAVVQEVVGEVLLDQLCIA